MRACLCATGTGAARSGERSAARAGGAPSTAKETSRCACPKGPFKSTLRRTFCPAIFAGTTIDTTPYPSGGPHDRDLQAAVSRAISANDWPTGLNAQYFIFTSKHAVPVSGYCAYHSAYNFDHDKTKPVVYAFTPYVGFFNGCDPPYYITPNNDIDSDGSIISISHEQMEMVTDPLINAWYGNGINEIGDICIFSFGEPYGPGQANMMINRHPYFLQEDWSQALTSCQPNL